MVCFSGGKDSIVVLEIFDEVRIEMGISKKIICTFFDEELISPTHEAFVKSVMDSGRFEFQWIVCQMNSEMYVLGKTTKYVQWDINRQWVRKPPEWATVILDATPVSEGDIFMHLFKGKYASIAVCNGIRANESRNRQVAVLNSSDMDKPYHLIEAVGQARVRIIYDWCTEDVFKYIHDKGIKYAPVYDFQTWGKTELRVATPMTIEGAKNVDKVRDYDPAFFNMFTKVFPEMLVQARYSRSMNKDYVYNKYGVSEEGIYNYIEDTLEGSAYNRAMMCVNRLFVVRQEDYAKDIFPSKYPLRHIFQGIVRGDYKKYIQPLDDVYATEQIMSEERAAYAEWKKRNKVDA